MNLVVDGIIYQLQPYGGISRLFNEILPRMCEIDESINITLLTHERSKQALPKHSEITQRALSLMENYFHLGGSCKPIGLLGRRITFRLCTGFGKGKIWHSTYYTLPGKWKGMQVVTVHDMVHERFVDLFPERKHDQFREKKRRCIMEADAIICVSEATRRDVQHFYGINSDYIRVIHHGYSNAFRQLEQWDDSLETLINQPFLLYVGTREHYKNFTRLIQTYSIFSHRNEVALVVVGKPWTPDEEHYLGKLGIQDSVHLLTDVDDRKLCRLYNKATALVYPSLYEGFGIPLLEAMACGCPVVASRIPSTIEVAGECPIYFEPNNKESLLTALDMVLFEGRDSTRVQVGFSQVKCYSWDKTARQTLDVYHELYRKMNINDVA